jgi:thioredoxin 1
MPLTATTDAAFAADVLTRDRPVLVHVTRADCVSCVQAAPIVAAVAQQLTGVADVLQLDCDRNPHAADLYGVDATPTLLLFDGGALRERVVGVKPLTTVLERLRPHLLEL